MPQGRIALLLLALTLLPLRLPVLRKVLKPLVAVSKNLSKLFKIYGSWELKTLLFLFRKLSWSVIKVQGKVP